MVSGSNFSLDSACWVPEVRRNVEYQRHPSVRRLAGVLHSFFFLVRFIYFWVYWVFVAAAGIACCSGQASRRGWLLLWSTGSRCMSFSGYGTLTQWSWHIGFV